MYFSCKLKRRNPSPIQSISVLYNYRDVLVDLWIQSIYCFDISVNYYTDFGYLPNLDIYALKRLQQTDLASHYFSGIQVTSIVV